MGEEELLNDDVLDEEAKLLQESMLEVVEEQMATDNPPEVKQTYERLVGEGHSDTEAKMYIAAIVVSECLSVVQKGRKYDEARYVKALHALPDSAHNAGL